MAEPGASSTGSKLAKAVPKSKAKRDPEEHEHLSQVPTNFKVGGNDPERVKRPASSSLPEPAADEPLLGDDRVDRQPKAAGRAPALVKRGKKLSDTAYSENHTTSDVAKPKEKSGMPFAEGIWIWSNFVELTDVPSLQRVCYYPRCLPTAPPVAICVGVLAEARKEYWDNR